MLSNNQWQGEVEEGRQVRFHADEAGHFFTSGVFHPTEGTIIS